MVVEGRVTSHCPHQEEDHLLADPLSLPDEPVGDLAERADDLGLQPGPFLDLSKGCLFGLLAALDHALRQPPGEVPFAGTPRRQGDLEASGVVPDHDAARGELRAGLHGHGAFQSVLEAMRATVARAARTRSFPRILSTALASPPAK